MLLEIVASPDDACRACPHLGEAGCESPADGPEESVAHLDHAVLAALRIRPGIHESSGIEAAVRSLERSALESLCALCSWFGRTDCQDRILDRPRE